MSRVRSTNVFTKSANSLIGRSLARADPGDSGTAACGRIAVPDALGICPALVILVIVLMVFTPL